MMPALDLPIKKPFQLYNMLFSSCFNDVDVSKLSGPQAVSHIMKDLNGEFIVNVQGALEDLEQISAVLNNVVKKIKGQDAKT